MSTEEVNKYKGLTREQLVQLIEKRDRQKKLGLVWERDVPACYDVICLNDLPAPNEERVMSTKEAAIEIIKRLPDDVTLADIMAELNFRHQVDEGLGAVGTTAGRPDDPAVDPRHRPQSIPADSQNAEPGGSASAASRASPRRGDSHCRPTQPRPRRFSASVRTT